MRVNQIKAFNTSDSVQVANIISDYLPHTCSQSAKGQLRKYKKAHVSHQKDSVSDGFSGLHS